MATADPVVPGRALGSGPPLLMLAGAGGSGASFLPLAAAWKQDFRCLMPDPVPPYPSGEAARALLAALDAAGIDGFHLLGVSLGGCVAQWLAALAGTRVLSLTLSATFARLDAETHARIDALRTARLTLSDAAFLPKWLGLLFGDDPWPRGVTVPPREAFAAQTEAALAHDGTAVLSGLRCPTRVTYGEDDRMIPPALSIALAEAIPGAAILAYPGGHMHWRALTPP